MKTQAPLLQAGRSPGGAALPAGKAALVLCLATLTGCAYHEQLHWSSRIRPMASAVDSMQLAPPRKGDVTRALCGGNLDPADVTLSRPAIEAVFKAPTPETWTLAFFTDSGLVDRTISLGEVTESILDKNPCRSLENLRRGFWQDYADACYLAYILKAFRLAAEQGLIRAVVHGGDSVQIGVRPEFETYVEVVGKFLIAGKAQGWEKYWTGTWWQTPLAGGKATFYQILGNHEVLFLGTFKGNRLFPVPSDGVRDASSFARLVASLPPWREQTEAGKTNAAFGEGKLRRGYYHVYHVLPDGKRVLLIMLNTSQGKVRDLLASCPKDVSFHPRLDSDQLDWLNARLQSAESDPNVGCVLVFGHHPLAEVALGMGHGTVGSTSSVGELPRRLTAFSKVKAYFCGHLHSGCPPVLHPGPYPVTEYVVPSLMEFPKCFALIHLSRQPATSDYRVSVRYHNLTELIQFRPQRELEAPGLFLGRNQGRLEAGLAKLDRATSRPAERIEAAAVACYRDAARDLAGNRSRNFPHSFQAKYAPELLHTYQEAQHAWELLKERARVMRREDARESWMQMASALQNSTPEAQTLWTLTLAPTYRPFDLNTNDHQSSATRPLEY